MLVGTFGASTRNSLTYLDETLLPRLERLVQGQPPAAGPVLLAIWER